MEQIEIQTEREVSGPEDNQEGSEKPPCASETGNLHTIPIPTLEVDIASQKYAGRLKSFINEWRTLTDNPLVLSWIQGLKLQFLQQPFQNSCKNMLKNPGKNILDSLKCLLSVGAVTPCRHTKNQFISPYFLREKSNGQFRFILNLKHLNEFCFNPPHFKLEDYRTVLKLLYPNCLFTCIDLKDAYFLIPIHSEHRKFLRFVFENQLYQFNCLPFGLSIAPYIFTKIMKPILMKLRTEGIICICYLDDILIISSSIKQGVEDVNKTVSILQQLGFIVNFNKSQLTLSTECTYLGFIFNSENMTVSLPQNKRQKIIENINKMLSQSRCTIREFAKLIGVLTAACPAVRYGWLYTKILEREKINFLKTKHSYNKYMLLSAKVKTELRWWCNNVKHSFNPIMKGTYDIVIFSDASKIGWGASCNGVNIHGFWNSQEIQMHINYLELLAAYNALKSFTKHQVNISILFRIDNVTAISFINKMGGVKYKKLHKVTKDIWQFCEKKRFSLFASYINTKDNIEADLESRCKKIDTEYELSNIAFQKICNKFGYPEIDLFATELNKKCKRYISWKPDPGSVDVDSFTISWTNYFFYAFPPFSMILKMLNKIVTDCATGIVVVPLWPAQPWFPLFRNLMIAKPIYFKPRRNLILSPFRKPHPLWRDTTLVAAHLSGLRFRKGRSLKKPFKE